MRPFKYLRPSSLAEACQMLSEYGESAKLIAGGQSLLPLLKQRILAPEYIIDLKHLAELNYIVERGDEIAIGAIVTHRDVETSPLIRQWFPVLVEMERWLGHPQIKNWGTLGGNLAHADPGGDPAPPLIALDAKVKVISRRGERIIPLEQFFQDYFTTALGPDEILAEIQLPKPQRLSGAAYRKEAIRASDMPIASVAAMVKLDGEKIVQTRIVLGGVGPTPLRARQAEELLQGKEIEAINLSEVAILASEEAAPTDDLEGSAQYKRRIVRVLAREIISRALERAQIRFKEA